MSVLNSEKSLSSQKYRKVIQDLKMVMQKNYRKLLEIKYKVNI